MPFWVLGLLYSSGGGLKHQNQKQYIKEGPLLSCLIESRASTAQKFLKNAQLLGTNDTRAVTSPASPDTRKISFRIIDAPELPRNLLLPHGDGPYDQTEPENRGNFGGFRADTGYLPPPFTTHPPLTHPGGAAGLQDTGRYDNSRLRPFNFTLNGYSVERSSTLEAFEVLKVRRSPRRGVISTLPVSKSPP
ncbi:uncharacterized protein BDW70DRAFT_134830 [Aspergillus foveolatus]|uniref:uncharacterized protein n=1 Tax=Aspergillus foveolatus TaxID=210207 RepID=UPI003CCE0B0C